MLIFRLIKEDVAASHHHGKNMILKKKSCISNKLLTFATLKKSIFDKKWNKKTKRKTLT